MVAFRDEGFGKTRIDPLLCRPLVEEAIERARALDQPPTGHWPKPLGTHA